MVSWAPPSLNPLIGNHQSHGLNLMLQAQHSLHLSWTLQTSSFYLFFSLLKPFQKSRVGVKL